MGRGERVDSKNSSKGHVSKRNVKSDDSDEDYRLEEDELDDQTDELESLTGDVSDEESIGNFRDEEDEDEVERKVVRSKSRKRSAGQVKKGIGKSSKRRKRISYAEEENDESGGDKEEEDDYDNDCDTDSDEFNLDFLDEEELPSSKRKYKKKGNTDDDEFNPDDQDILDEEDLPSSKGRNKGKGDSGDDDFNPDDQDMPSLKGKKKKRGDTDDDDDFDPDDQDSLDEEEEIPSPKGKKKKKSSMDDEEFNPDDLDLLDEEEASSKEKYNEKGGTDDDNFYPDDRDFLDVDEQVSSPKRKNKKNYDTDDDEFNPDDLDLLDDEEDVPSSKEKYKKKGDTDDDEFYPDDLDLLEEEEELSSLKGKNKKKGLYSLKRKGSVTRPKKKPQKKKRKGSSRSTKSTSSQSRKSKNKVSSSMRICKRMPRRRKKNSGLSSDSDFASSKSTDHEFTISEEEQEQVKEANDFFHRETSNKRRVNRDQEDAAYNQPRNLPRRKGKEKAREVKDDDVAEKVCGICLTKEGKNTVRGALDCCNHFFCFACIIEWSKVESRCPLCKQRFITISKSAKNPTRLDLRDVVIPVPERDQVYQPSEEELRGYLDPYEHVLCTECHEGGDDALMLLCDLCDSPAHTYCVGLGREVPDGNWYCEGCRPSALEFTSSHPQEHATAERLDNNIPLNEPCTFENMAEIDLNITIPETLTPAYGLQAPPPASGVGVSTLSGRRRVHRLQYFLSSNRIGVRVDPTNVFGSWGDRSTQSPSIETGATDFGALYHAEYLDRLHENSFVSPTNGEFFPGRQTSTLQVPSVADSASYGCMQFGQVGCEWLQPCTSRLNLGSGTSMSPLCNGDVDQNTGKQQLQ